MGGTGSGRKPTSRRTLQDATRLDIRELYRAGNIHQHAAWYQDVQLTWSPCTYGGFRPWFLYPACFRRCAVLYDDVCRLCTGLNYQSQYDDRIERLKQRSDSLRRRLLYSGTLFSLPPGRPQHMRNATYETLLDEIQQTELCIAQETVADPEELCQWINDMFAATKRLNRRF